MSIALAIGIGVVVALLWLRREGEPAAMPVPSEAGSLPARSAATSPETPDFPSPPPATSAIQKPPPPIAAPTIAYDNSTYEKMLALAQSRSDEVRAAKDITNWHERFMLTPDDPAWSRPTEQALQHYFQKGYSGRNFEVTSIACRAEGCEVQMLNTMPAFDGLNVVPPQSEEFGLEMRKVFELTHEPRPLGEAGIRLDNSVATPAGDRMGRMIWYRRVPTAP